MSKTIGLKQLAQKQFTLIQGLPQRLTDAIGTPDDAFDCIIYGPSNNGKSSFVAEFVVDLIEALQCKAEYISYEEGHGRTIQLTMVERYNMLERIPNSLLLTDRYTFAELDKRMDRRQSAKIWVIDSLQASGMTAQNIAYLKEKYVLSKRRKILIIVSWGEGKEPIGSHARDVKFYAALKLRVTNLIMFSQGRYGGGEPYVIHRETAIRRCGGEAAFYKALGQKPPAKPKGAKKKPKPEKTEE